jgi:hypothetical protein
MSETQRFLEQLPGLLAQQQTLIAPTVQNTPGWLQQFISSALRSGTSELVGLPGQWTQALTGVSPEQNDQWRRENFLSGLGSQLVGAIAPYGVALRGGYALGSRVLPNLFSAERLAAAPIATGFARGVVAEAPFAVGRTIASPILGGDMEATALSAGIDLALGGAIGGGAGFLWSRRAGSNITRAQEEQLAQIMPSYQLQLPTQERLKQVLAFRQQGNLDGPLARLIPDIEEQLRREIRLERPDGPLRITFEGRTAAESNDLLADIYNRTNVRDVAVRRFAQAGREGFADRQSWEAALNAVNLPPNWEIAVQFPRFVEPKTEEAAKRLFTRFNNTLVAVHDNWFIGRGVNPEGMFLIARRIGNGQPNINDRWFVGFTNRPSALVADLPMMERSDRLAKFFTGLDRADLQKRIAETAKVDPNNVLSLYKELEELYPATIRHAPRDKDYLASAARLLPENIRKLAKEYQPLVNRLWTNIKGGIAPGQFQFNDAPLARNIMFKAAAIYDRARGRAAKALYGDETLARQGLAGAIINPKKEQIGGVRRVWEELKESDIPTLAKVIADVDPNGLGLTRGAKGQDFDTALREALKHAKDNDQAKRIEAFIRAAKAANDEAFVHVNSVRRALDMPEITALDNRVLPHFWAGTHRWRLLDEQGRTVYMAWGRNSAEVAKHADSAAAKFGLRKDPKGPFTAGRAEDLDEALLMRRRPNVEPRADDAGTARVPDILAKQRTGVGGYLLDPDGPLPNKKELWDIVQSGIEQTETAAAELVVKHLLGPRLAEVRAAYGPEVSRQLLRRIQDMSGTQGPFSAWQNKAVEKMLGTGKNGATKLAANINRVETAFNLTFFNMGYNVLNALTPLITLGPKLALLRTVPVEQLGRYFDTIPALAQNGVRGILNIPSPMKLMKDGWRAMREPTQLERAMFNRALKEQVIAPKFIEQEVGLKSARADSIRRIAQGEDSLFETAMNFVETPSRVIEEMTRGHAFATGLRVGQIIGFKGEALYQFAKEIAYRSMYGYATHDRARVFQGPIGNVAGLFKNWMLHHIGDWSAYAGEAFRRGNFRPLLWVGTSTAGIAGLGGLPFVQGLDRFQAATSNPGIMETLYAALNGQENPLLADAAFYGLPGLLGISLQSAGAAPFNDPSRDISFLFSIAALRRAEALANFGEEFINTFIATGGNPLQNERVWDRAWYAMTPRTIYKAMAQVENGALRALRNGAPIYEGITLGQYISNMFGLTPTAIARAWEANSALWERRDRAAAAVSRFGETLAQGFLQNNQKLINDSIAQAIAAGVDISRVLQSAQVRMVRGMLPTVPYDYISDPDNARFMDVLGLLR